jgi:hypothetical protein
MKGLLLEPEDTKYEAAALLFFGGMAIFLRILGLVTAGAIEMDGVEYAGAAELFARGEFGQVVAPWVYDMEIQALDSRTAGEVYLSTLPRLKEA